jgi:hypothetical protein
MTEVNDLAGQHEVIAENLQSNVIREVSILVKDFKEERKKVYNKKCFFSSPNLPLLLWYQTHNIHKVQTPPQILYTEV